MIASGRAVLRARRPLLTWLVRHFKKELNGDLLQLSGGQGAYSYLCQLDFTDFITACAFGGATTEPLIVPPV